MKKSLKKRFIVFSMTAITCLLLFLVLAINGLNCLMLERQSDAVMETLVDADGAFNKMDFNRPPPFAGPLDMDRMRSMRFFMVHTDDEGNILDINTDQISSIDKATAENFAQSVMNGGKESGKIEGY